MTDTGITSVHIDERDDRSVTVSTRHHGLPPDAPAEWRERGFNSYEEHTVYTSVDALGVVGWTHLPIERWESADLSDNRRAVALTGPGTSVRFHADATTTRHRRGLLSGGR
ncbi:hypothetical protein [Streptomyces sp. NBC_01803]|uniref:hypothetical protein n=1 Tax=Streptomyces sp. NBC_01803 TaxID=2975946 RepID=UPI002DDC1088|nr:hypothetical protein [Streptomyces sp. NBC_01803]WSA43080.1 hypothetical protein OIE51_02040 [Streptomyces sp. NBC_01803]